MKIILVSVAFATLMASPPFAQPQATEGPSHSRAYPEQKKQLKHLRRPIEASTGPRGTPISLRRMRTP